MTPDEILKICRETLPDTVLVESWGERGIFYNVDQTLSCRYSALHSDSSALP